MLSIVLQLQPVLICPTYDLCTLLSSPTYNAYISDPRDAPSVIWILPSILRPHTYLTAVGAVTCTTQRNHFFYFLIPEFSSNPNRHSSALPFHITLNPQIKTKISHLPDDDSNTLLHPGPPPTPALTTWTFLLYLTSPATGCTGGETVFYPEPVHPPTSSKKSKKDMVQPEPIVIGLETGMALLHRHGKDCMLHEGREVLEGEKWVIRSDLCVRR